MTPPSYVATFVHEAEELLERIEAAILALETSPGDGELINQLFRAFHTLKGSAGVAGIGPIAAFTHHVETAMDRVRSGAVALTPPLVSLVLASKDHVAALLAGATGGEPADPARGQAIVAQLEVLTAAAPTAAAPPLEITRRSIPLLVDYLVTFTLTGDAEQQRALELTPEAPPESLVEQLRGLGACTVVDSSGERGPAPAWQFLITTAEDQDAIHDAFIFFAGAGDLKIERGLSEFTDDPAGAPEAVAPAPPAPPPAPASAPPAPPHPQAMPVIHTQMLSPIPAPGPPARPAQAVSAMHTQAVSAIHTQALPTHTASQALPTQSQSLSSMATTALPRIAGKAEQTVRVSSERLDRLVKLIGEMVITQSRLQQVCSVNPAPELTGPVEAFERLIADLRDGVLGLRMVPVGTMFQRFHRLIRDLSGQLDKQVDLVTSGDDTELDKTVIDQLGDAVVHILRNCMDHGIEAPTARVAAGKSPRGTLRLAAAHEGTHVVITISDDGRGIDLAAVRRKAEAQGLVAPGEVLSEHDTIALVLRPGFSTAAAVTELSGRGVGMDVVKRTVEGLRGTLSIASDTGHGTEIRLTLPLTLAIIDGLLVEVDGDRFVVPMAAVTENVELTAADRRAHNGRNLVALRGELVPYFRLRELFGSASDDPDLEKVVIVSVEGQRVGLVVDRVLGSHQTVIQPLGPFYRGVNLFSGTTIMGDGRVAMILDLPGTLRAGHRGAPSRSGLKVAS